MGLENDASLGFTTSMGLRPRTEDTDNRIFFAKTSIYSFHLDPNNGRSKADFAEFFSSDRRSWRRWYLPVFCQCPMLLCMLALTTVALHRPVSQ
jgi:hypothetical protein